MADQADKKTINLSEADTKILLSIMKNLTSDIPFDATAVAEECGYKSAKTVKDVWNRLKKAKLGVTTTATPTKRTTPAKKRKGGEEARDDAEVGSPTPTKKARTLKAKKEVKDEDEDAEEDGEKE